MYAVSIELFLQVNVRITSQECPFGQNLHINSLHNLVFLIYMQIGMIFSFFPKGAALLELY